MLDDLILHVGVDIGFRRDSSAVACVAQHPEQQLYLLWGIRIWAPPVKIHKEVTGFLLSLLKKQRVAKVSYDPYQFVSEAERLEEAGYKRLLKEVNQQTEMPKYANTLDSHLRQGTFLPFTDPVLRQHFASCNARQEERGFRIVKKTQSRQIDGVVAIAMALAGATEDTGYLAHPSWSEEKHTTSLLDLP